MKYLLIVDLQKQFADLENGCENYYKCLHYIKHKMYSYDGAVATLFRQDSHNLNYKKHLKWDGCEDSSYSDLEFYDPEKWKGVILTKSGYGDNTPNHALTSTCFEKEDQIDIIGCDADACVMAICFQLWDAGFTNIRILTDYIYTTADASAVGIDKSNWIQMMKRNFGDCVVEQNGEKCRLNLL